MTPPQGRSGPRRCVYATSGWGVHDERWVSALEEVGFLTSVVSLGRDVPDPDALLAAVVSAAEGGHPVLAGPIDPVTSTLAGNGLRLVGLSWGYDLIALDDAGAELGWLAGLAGLIVDTTANRAIAERAGIAPERVTLLPWGVDIDSFPFRESTGGGSAENPTQAPYLLSLRAHEPIYRVSDILEAFALLSAGIRDGEATPRLVVGHSGSLGADLVRLAEDLHIDDRVRFPGTVAERDLTPLLQGAAGYVTASEVDGTSVTLLQAMACGAPVIASDTPGNRDWVVDGVTGFTFPTGDVPALALAMAGVLDRYPVEITQRARAVVEREADWHRNLGRLSAVMALS